MPTDPEDITDPWNDSTFTDVDVLLADGQLGFSTFSGMTEEEEGTPDDDLITGFGDNEPSAKFTPGSSTPVSTYTGAGKHVLTTAPTEDSSVLRRVDVSGGDVITPQINFNSDKTTKLVWNDPYIELWISGFIVTRWNA